MHTITGNVLTNGSVLVNGTKIEKVAADDTSLSATKTVDLKGLRIYPGMIALDTSLGLSEISGVRSTRDNSEVGEYTPDVQSWIAVNPDSELLPVARANGVTYIEPAPQGGIVAGQSGLVALDGWTMEKMAFKAPAALHIYWPDMDLNTTPKEKFKDQSKFKSLEDQSRERQKKLKALEDFFDDARAYAKAKAQPNAQLVPAWEAVQPYVRSELPVMIHADEVRQIKSAVAWATTNKFKAVLVGGRDAWMTAELLASNNIPVIFEHVFTQPARDSDSYDVHYKASAVLHKAGVKVITSLGATTFDAALIKNLPYQAAQAVGFGFPHDEALKSITLYPAQVVGVADRLGSIEPGKEASFVVTDGDLLDIRTHVKQVWISGKEVSLETRHTRLYEKYKNRPKAQ